jgi:hypothetical protein
MMPKDSRGGVGATSLLGVGCIVSWLPGIAKRAREASIVLVDVYCGASAGIVDTLIAAEAMRTMILLMSELHEVSC